LRVPEKRRREARLRRKPLLWEASHLLLAHVDEGQALAYVVTVSLCAGRPSDTVLRTATATLLVGAAD
jgi:hypothetical protein